nr:reverse transcriptase domain-containing protein [Tanacetum cinerariifolium]
PPQKNNGPPLMVRPNEQAPRLMEELCQPSINRRGRPIASIPIQAMDFGLRHHMIQQVENTCQFQGLPGDDAYQHIDKFLEITRHMKQNGVSDDALCLSLFPYSLTHHAIACNTIANPRGDFKAITTRRSVSYDGPPIPPPTSSLPKVVERVLEVKKDMIQPIVDYVVDPRVPLILGRPFLRTERALIDVYGEELTLRVNDEAITFKVGQTLKYSYSDAESVNQIDVIGVACEEYVQEVLGFSEIPKSGSPTPTLDSIISSSSPSFTPFEGSDFSLEEIETFLRTPDELSNLDDDYYDTEGDILYLENFLNKNPSPNLPPIKTEDLKQVDATMSKPSIEEQPELELKELPSHLEYTFLEGTDKLPVIIFKELKDEEKSTLLKVLKSHKWAIA